MTPQMKILIFHMRYHPDKTGTAPIITQLAQDLAASGSEVTVIASLPHYGRTTIHPDYRDFDGLFHQEEEVGVKIIRTPVFLPRHSSIFSRVLNYLSYNLFSVIAGFKVTKSDVILAVNPPITTTFSAWVLSIFHRAPLIVGIQDVWPDCLIQVNKLENKVAIFFSRILEKMQYSVAKKIIVLSPGMRENLENKGVRTEKIEIIANWADTTNVKPLPKENDFYIAQELNNYFVVLFAGNHGYISGLEIIIQAAELLKEKEDILFLLAGEGSVKNDLIKQVEKKGLKNVRFLSTQPEKEWLEMLAASDLGLVSLRSDLAGLNVPSKVYTLMSAARPIIASVPEESEVAKLVLNAKSGIICRPDDPNDLAEKILFMKDQTKLMEEFGKNGRKFMLNNFNRQRQTAMYLTILESTQIRD
jgi:colanic acid biosynthesis glycosyl transferase WcaI